MRIEGQIQAIDSVTSSKQQKNLKPDKQTDENNGEQLKLEDTPTPKEKLKQAVDSINELYGITNRELKFVFHEGLEEYFVQLVNSETEEVVREIPSKKLLDVFYEMQKLIGMIVDEKI